MNRSTRVLAIALLLSPGLDARQDPPRPLLEIAGARALDAGDRTSLLLVVRNPGDREVRIRDLFLGGRPIGDLQVPSDPARPRSFGKGVDWIDLRPAVIPPHGAGALLLGSVARELREPKLALTANTDRGEADLSCPTPRPESLRVASAAFSPDLKSLTLLVRNDGARKVTIQKVEFNGADVAAVIRGACVAPTMLAKITVETRVAAAAPCTLRVLADGESATAAFRAYPAESVNYPFYGQHADRRDLAEKNMDVYVTRQEAGVHGVEEMDRNGGRMTDAMVRRLGKSAASFGTSTQSWAWYMEDDAGWGRPRPQSLIDVGRFLREHGSSQPQFVCNPADLRRYAWTHDFYMNYAYHTTHQGSDPTTFGGERSLDLIRELNEPAPILYLVDAVGQSSRWISVAEEELASYAMLGRGARHFGWFLVPSVWEQGGALGGGIDPVERRPWRYQEGATACVPVWNQIGNIAGVLKALQPYVRSSAKLPSRLREDRIEVLPVLAEDDLVITTLLNRRLRCTYPRDDADGRSSGGLKLKPHRDVAITHPIPEWIHPVRVLAFDHDRGFRELPFTERNHVLEVQVDALDTSTLLFACASEAQAQSLRKEVLSRLGPGVGGSAVQPDLTLGRESLAPRRWDDPEKNYRTALTVRGPLAEGAWIRGSLSVEGRALGYFDPRTVTTFHAGRSMTARVDYFRPLYRPSEGAAPWSLGKDNRNATIEATPEEVRISSHWTSGYGYLSLRTPLDPEYDLLEIRRSIEGHLEPLLPGVGLRRAMEERVWGQSEVVEAADGGMSLSRIRWRAMIEAAKKTPPPDGCRFSAQTYEGTYRFGELRQCRSEPIVFVRNPSELRAGESRSFDVYWGYGIAPSAETPVLAVADRPTDAAPATAAAVDGFRIAEADEASLRSEARLDAAWIEGRGADGAPVFFENLRSTDGLRWTRRGAARTAERVTAYGAGPHGRVVAVTLRAPAAPPSLRRLAEVPGQIEALAASADGRLVVAGADRVRAFDDAGREQWVVDVGENRRQQERFGPGRNVDQVEIRDAERRVAARTFRWNEKARAYENATTVLLSFEGRELGREGYDWKAAGAAPRAPSGAAPYCHLSFALKDGSRVAATTQGRIQLLGADGKVRWESRRPSRIDAAILLEQDGRLAVAYKSYPHRWDWTFAPTLEFLSLADGKSVALAMGEEADDRGHLGTELCLARGASSSRIYLGDPRGRIFLYDLR